MNCDIIKDLIPLYIDDCCSDESANTVREHIKKCPECKDILDAMSTPSSVHKTPSPPAVISRLNDFKASVMQTVMLFISFIAITVGVALEATTPLGVMNGCWASALIIPSTGFMLSLANWYFIRLYKSRRSFSNSSLLVTCGLILGGYVWAFAHYDMIFVQKNIVFHMIGVLLTALACVLTKVLSCKYARMLGKF